MNTFMNFEKRSLEGGGIRGGVGALGRVRASLLVVSDLAPASLLCSPGMSAGRLTQGLQRVVQDFGAIANV